MITVPDRLLGLPGITVLHRSEGLLALTKELTEPLYDRQSLLRMHVLIQLRAGSQEIETDTGNRLRLAAGDERLLRRGIYSVTDLLPPDGDPFLARLLYFDERVLRTGNDGPADRAALLTELRSLDNIDQLTARRRTDPLPFLERHFDKPLTLEDFALLTGSSVSTFQRTFRQRTGTSPRRWIIEKRMARARDLLSRQNYRTRDLALAVGYRNTSHFIRQYRATFGHTPTDI